MLRSLMPVYADVTYDEGVEPGAVWRRAIGRACGVPPDDVVVLFGWKAGVPVVFPFVVVRPLRWEGLSAIRL